MRQPEDDKYRDLALFLTLLMMLIVGATMLGMAIVAFIVMIGQQVMAWFK